MTARTAPGHGISLLRSPTDFGLSPRLLSSPATVVMLLVAVVLGGAVLFGFWLLAWIQVLSLAEVLLAAGARSPLAPERASRMLLLLPPMAGTAASVLVGGWLYLTRRQSEATFAGDEPTSRLDVSLPWTAALLLVACLGFLAYARLVFLYHELHDANDEGTFLYAARLAMSGLLPYRDFYFDQSPFFPYLVGLAMAPFQYDAAASRLVVTAFELATLLVTFVAAERLGGRVAGLAAVALLVTNLDFVTNLAEGMHTNGSFAAFLVASTVLALCVERPGLALVLAALAAGVRLSLFPLPVTVACYLALGRRRPHAALWGGLLVALLILGPLVALGGERMWFVLKSFRAEVQLQWNGVDTSLEAVVEYVRGLTPRLALAYAAFLLGAIPAVALVWTRRFPRWPLGATLAVGCAALLLLNMSIYPGSLRYVATLLPMLAVLDSVALVTLVRPLLADARQRLAGQVVLATFGGLVLLSPLLASRGPEFIQQNKGKSSVEQLRTMSAYVREIGGPNATLLTLEQAIGAQSGLRLLPGLEAGSWTLVRDAADARRLGLLNYDMLIQKVAEGAGDVVVESDRWGLYGSALKVSLDERQTMKRALESAYVLRATFEDMPDWGDVRVYTRKVKSEACSVQSW